MSGYVDYLCLSTLLSLQRPITGHVAAELTFIIAHQVHELWFKLILDRLRQSVVAMDADDTRSACVHLRHAVRVEKLMFEQLALLEDLDHAQFAEIRTRLQGASGAESRQYHVIELYSRNRCDSPGAGRDVWTAFVDLLRRRWDPALPLADSAEIARWLAEIEASDKPEALVIRDLMEQLLDHDHH